MAHPPSKQSNPYHDLILKAAEKYGVDASRAPVMEALVQSDDWKSAPGAIQRAALRIALSSDAPDKINVGDKRVLEAEAGRTMHNARVKEEKKRIIEEAKVREDVLKLPPPRRERCCKTSGHCWKPIA